MSQTNHVMRESNKEGLAVVFTIKKEYKEASQLSLLAEPKIFNEDYWAIKTEELLKPHNIKTEHNVINNIERECDLNPQITKTKEEILESEEKESQQRNYKWIDIEIKDDVGKLRNEQKNDLNIKSLRTRLDIVFNSDDGKSYHCGVCEYETIHQKTLIKHVQTHSDENNLLGDAKGNCILLENKISHTNKRLYLCSHCKYTSSNKAHLTMHSRQHTGEKPYACEHCDYKSSSKSNLTRHNRQHTSEKPYACNHCEYRSSSNYNLMGHMRQHTGEKPYACKHCDYRSSSQTSLTRHIRQHTGEKPYACDHCHYRSSYKANLKSHSRKHTGEKPYACNECNYRSSNKPQIIFHKRQHSGEKPFVCNYCDYRSIQKAHLLRHIKKHSNLF